jgi:phosphatidylserine/phosphatidylglycerophosphate/cardiolipin synthase-like enzyme/membrane protein DedA with SNARE-associated domain
MPPTTTESAPLLCTGSNCWRHSAAQRLALLIDGENYFGAVRAALRGARRRICILGWDIHSRTDLLPGGDDDGLPRQLAPFLRRLLERRKALEIRLLTWDFAMIYAMEREWVPVFRPHWFRHPRFRFEMDDRHPVAASQHQKVITVDDTLAFVGGFDLSKWRWDSRAHDPDDPRRIDPDGAPYPPFHDIQALVDGDAARDLARLALARWTRATGERLELLDCRDRPPWPDCVEPQFRDLPVAISRTLPAHEEQLEVREIERLLLDAIAAARRFVYIENQYLTSGLIAKALERRLEEADGPELLLLLPRQTGAWLEQKTMDVLRARLVQRLRRADRHGHLRVCFPHRAGLDQRHCLSLHSKLMIVDDHLLTVGSANLSNRSMGLDSECNVALEARDAATAAAIARLRADLLAEHLGREPAAVAALFTDTERVLPRLDAFDDRAGHGLRPLVDTIPEELDREVPDGNILDPERPLQPEELVQRMVTRPAPLLLRRRLIVALLLMFVLLALAALWRWSPLGELVDVETLTRLGARIAGSPFAGLAVVATFVVASLVVAPFTLLVVATALVFTPGLAFLYAMAGAVAAAMTNYAIGAHLGRRLVRRLVGARLNRLGRKLADRGILAVALLRLVPIAPFTVVNLAAGASHLRARDFFFGTLLGLVPGVFAMTFFVDGLLALVFSTDRFDYRLLLLAGTLLVLLLVVGIRRQRQVARRHD